jgi:hypothetical protein
VIWHCVHDCRWPYLRNVQNPYQSLKTTVQTNGATGFRIIPRFASELYFNVRLAGFLMFAVQPQTQWQ